ncbi:amidase [Arthrobacter phage HunterDalle]|uniref:N-acetylmuramoyl-L-alanine amidase n=2 Tax=Korravirus hunterdalle TaxID=1982080 RepID=A0A0U4B7G6_9CAUD|nr:amidase [Arthrobacter phage HunterDalle]ALY09171.1 endolysin [Arthrobacter phage HunterDalle]ALY10686.1 endolysin [Arthrobacter phage Vulture]
MSTQYELFEGHTSKNFTPGHLANQVWGQGNRRVESITIHWWGNYGQEFWTVENFLCTNTKPTSAHYVVQDGLVSCIVSPDDCAWHAGNPYGNTTSIGIECRPEATDGDYLTVAALIAFLRGIYGDVPLVHHYEWQSTACPGTYDLARLDALARGITTSNLGDELTVAEVDRAIAYIKALASDGWVDSKGKLHPGFMWTIEENQKRIDALPAAVAKEVWGRQINVGTAEKPVLVPAIQYLADIGTDTRAIRATPVSGGGSVDTEAVAQSVFDKIIAWLKR